MPEGKQTEAALNMWSTRLEMKHLLTNQETNTLFKNLLSFTKIRRDWRNPHIPHQCD